MDIRSLPSKTPSRLQQPYYSKALLSKESPKGSVTPTTRRRHSLVNGLKSNAVNGDSLCINETNSPNYKNYRDVSYHLPTLFNFRPCKTYQNSPNLERSIYRSENPGFMSIIEPPSSDSIVEHGIRILESRKRIQSSDELDTNCSAIHQHEIDPDWNDAKRRRINQVSHPRLPDIFTVGSKDADCFSYTSLHELTHDNSDQLARKETISRTSKSIQTQNVATNNGDSPVSPICAKKGDEAAALRRRIPYMSPEELEAHLSSTKALRSGQPHPNSMESADMDEDLELIPLGNNRKRVTARRQLIQNEALPQVSPSPSDENPKLISSKSCATSDPSIDLDHPSVPSSTNSLAKFISELENHGFNSSRNSGSILSVSVTKYPAKLGDIHNYTQSDIGSRVQRIRNLLSRDSPEPKPFNSQGKIEPQTSSVSLFTTTVATTSANVIKPSDFFTTSTSGFSSTSALTTSAQLLTKPLSSPNLFNIPKASNVPSTLPSPLSIIPSASGIVTSSVSPISTASMTSNSITTTSTWNSTTAIAPVGTTAPCYTSTSSPSTSVAVQSSVPTATTAGYSFSLPKPTNTIATFTGFTPMVSTSAPSTLTQSSPLATGTNLSSIAGLPNSGSITTAPTSSSFALKITPAPSSGIVNTSNSGLTLPTNNMFDFTNKLKSNPNAPTLSPFATSSSSSVANPTQLNFPSPQPTISPAVSIPSISATTSGSLITSTAPTSSTFQFPLPAFGPSVLGNASDANKPGTSQANIFSTAPTSNSLSSVGPFSPSSLFTVSTAASSNPLVLATTTSAGLFPFGTAVASTSTQGISTFTGFNFSNIKTPAMPSATTTQTSLGATIVSPSPSNNTLSSLFSVSTPVATAVTTTTPITGLFGSGFQTTSNSFSFQASVSSATSPTISFPFTAQTTKTNASNMFATTTSSQAAPASSTNLFTLGLKPASVTPAQTKPAPLFGSNPTPSLSFPSPTAPTSTTTSTAGAFTFNSASTGLASSATAPAQLFQFGSTNTFSSPPTTSSTKTTQPFSFGLSAPLFSFGQTPQSQAQPTQSSFNAPGFGTSTATSTGTTTGGFNFSHSVPSFGSIGSSATNFGGFNFGVTPAAATTTISPSPSGFTFGQTTTNPPTDSTPNPFMFGTSATNPASLPRRRPLSSRRSRRP